MWRADRTHAMLVVLCGLTAAFTACALLLSRPPAVRTIIAAQRDVAYTIQRDAIESYLHAAQRVQFDFGAGRIPRAEALRRALALVVPPMLKERHLQWVQALRTGRDSAAAFLVQEYAFIAPLD